eukprot:6178556-Pleurochrysis_carterae.AAC.6
MASPCGYEDISLTHWVTRRMHAYEGVVAYEVRSGSMSHVGDTRVSSAASAPRCGLTKHASLRQATWPFLP